MKSILSSSASTTVTTTSSSTKIWDKYKDCVKKYYNEKIRSDPGLFAKDLAQFYYEQCLVYPLPAFIKQRHNIIMPILTLPLRINLIRSPLIGCSNQLNVNIIPNIINIMNTYWEQAGIQFEIIEITEPTINPTLVNEKELQTFIMHKLKRGQDGRMMYRKERSIYFLDILLSSLQYQSTRNTYDVWFIDMVGHESQGMCIDRKTQTILMGERSTKGYDMPTKRPHDCLAKTMAHELGHALLLDHPMRKYFLDGQSQIINKSKTNLMQGGVDSRGGGGYYLEQWQICIARYAAERFLHKTNKRQAKSNK